MSVYLHSAIGRERRRLQYLTEHVTADPHVPDAVAAHVQAAVDALTDAQLELTALIDRQVADARR